MNTDTTLQELYGEVCDAHQAITDFRHKLLTLIPTLSGAGFALIIARGSDLNPGLLLPVGIFGLLVTLGLFSFELRGIVLCRELVLRGGELERVMQDDVAREDIRDIRGHFRCRKEGGRLGDVWDLIKHDGPISVAAASCIVYSTVLLGWVGVICVAIARLVINS